MPYTALPDRRIPYDNDGTVVAVGTLTAGIQTYPIQAHVQLLQDTLFRTVATGFSAISDATHYAAVWFFFPEKREVTAWAGGWYGTYSGPEASSAYSGQAWHGSTDTTNGLDGAWETASLPSSNWAFGNDYTWRETIRPISFTGGKNVVRHTYLPGGNVSASMASLHLYGEKYAGETVHDLVFINHDDTPGVEFTAPEDFGDQPLGTSVVRQFRVKNTSASRTATNVNLQCNDTDFVISEDGVTWVVTINIASLAPGAESATLYVRCTTPDPGNLLGPRFARIVCVAEDGSGGNFFEA